MKNIMFIISSFAGGGAERVTVNLANALSRKYNVCVVTLFSNPDDYYPDDNVTVIKYSDYINNPGLLRKNMPHGYLDRLLWVSRIKREFKPAATISMLEVPNLINALAHFGDFRIISERADPSVIGGRYLRSIKCATKFADHTVFQSKRVQNMFPRNVRRKSSIILNPVDVRTKASEHRVKRIVTAGRLTEQKNHKMLIRAFERFCRTHDGYTLEIYGKGELKDELKALARQLRIEDKVAINDFAPDLHERIRNAEMFILPSDFEGLSNALLEAMMMGLPCISTDCAGSDEVIDNMESGILVPVGDEDALLTAMNMMADSEQLRCQIAEKGKKASERFRTDTVVQQWIELIERNTKQEQ